MAAFLPANSDVALNLALALVSCSEAPLLLLDGEFRVIAASSSFCLSFSVDPVTVQGMRIGDLGGGDWNSPRLESLLVATAADHASIDAYEMDLFPKDRERRTLILRAQKLDYGSPDHTRILLTVSDITDARASEKVKDDLIREKAVLLQEVQHRVANSLQIIASVLLQSARRVNSEETRVHLHDAHHRVMSIAALQKQLATTNNADVELDSYFRQLCHSISGSMISDRDQLSLEVAVDDSEVGANESISLGLVVTELVINALKHAFPAGRKGLVTVSYQSKGPNWTLSVTDDGVGMPLESEPPARAGLGTSIIEALAHQLNAEVTLVRMTPGTAVWLKHNPVHVVGTAFNEPTAAAV